MTGLAVTQYEEPPPSIPEAFAALQRAMRRAMSDRKTKTGFDIKITGFLEFHAEDLFTETAKDPKVLRKELEEVLEKHGVESIKWKIDHRDRKTIAAPDEG